MARLPDSFWDDEPEAPTITVPKGWSVAETDHDDEPEAAQEDEQIDSYDGDEPLEDMEARLYDEPEAYPETLEQRLPRPKKKPSFLDDDFDDEPAPVAKAAPKKKPAFLDDDFDDEPEPVKVRHTEPEEELDEAAAQEEAKAAWEEPAPYKAPAPKEVVVPLKRLSEKALLVSLNISQWSGRRFDRAISEEVNASKAATTNAGRFNKMLLPDCAELAEVHRQTSSLRNWFVEKTLPWMNDGARITPSATYLDFTSEFRRRESEWTKAVDALIAAYPALKAKAPQQLQSMYNPEDYPVTWELRSKFSMGIRAFPLPDRDDFRVEVDTATMQALKDSMADVEGDLARQVVGECYQRLGKAVGAMAERLGDPDAVFRNSLVENLAEAVSALKDLNICGDPELEKLRRKVEGTLTGYTADQLRSDVRSRKLAADAAKQAVAEITSRMAGLY